MFAISGVLTKLAVSYLTDDDGYICAAIVPELESNLGQLMTHDLDAAELVRIGWIDIIESLPKLRAATLMQELHGVDIKFAIEHFNSNDLFSQAALDGSIRMLATIKSWGGDISRTTYTVRNGHIGATRALLRWGHVAKMVHYVEPHTPVVMIKLVLNEILKFDATIKINGGTTSNVVHIMKSSIMCGNIRLMKFLRRRMHGSPKNFIRDNYDEFLTTAMNYAAIRPAKLLKCWIGRDITHPELQVQHDELPAYCEFGRKFLEQWMSKLAKSQPKQN